MQASIRNIWIFGMYFHASLAAVCGATYYVGPGGTNDFLTIQEAADVVNPGDTVVVRDGLYTRSYYGLVTLTRSGNSLNWITFRAENKGGAVLDGQNNATTYCFVPEAQVDYVRIQGFEIRNFAGTAIYVGLGGSNFDISENHIHHMGRLVQKLGEAESLSGIMHTPSSFRKM